MEMAMCTSVMFWGSLVEVTVRVHHSAYIRLPDIQVLSGAHHLAQEHNIPILVFQCKGENVRCRSQKRKKGTGPGTL